MAGLISATEDSLLSEIQIGNTELAQEAVSAIAAAMWTNKSITALDLSRPRLFSLQQETSLHLARMLGVSLVDLRRVGRKRIYGGVVPKSRGERRE